MAVMGWCQPSFCPLKLLLKLGSRYARLDLRLLLRQYGLVGRLPPPHPHSNIPARLLLHDVQEDEGEVELSRPQTKPHLDPLLQPAAHFNSTI